MKRLLIVLVTISVLLPLAGYTYWEYVVRRPTATDDPWGLWIAALKGFEGTVTYVGDRDGYSYFRTGKDKTCRYMRPTSDLNLPRTFPFGVETPYRVTQEMVPQYKPRTTNERTNSTVEMSAEGG